MTAVLVAIVLVFFVLTAVVGFYFVRRLDSVPPPVDLPFALEDDAADREARWESLSTRGTELLERRVELDSTRGTLGGNAQIFEAFEALEKRLRAGEITEQEFEAEKVRLLSG